MALRLVDRTRVTDAGETELQCSRCSLWRLAGEFKHRNDVPTGICTPCTRTAQRRYYRQNPPVIDRAKRRAANKRFRTKIKADPELRVRHRETERIGYRLRQEKKGRALDSLRVVSTAAKGKTAHGWLPSAPLVAFVEARVEHEREFAGVLNRTGVGCVGIGSVCKELGIYERTFRRWRSGERVRLTTAEGILLRAGAEWAEVWSPDDHPELYAGLLASIA